MTRSCGAAARAMAPALALLTALCAGSCRRGEKKPARPNVVFVLVDTLRADRLGAWGDRGGHSPQLDALARESVLFEHAVAPSSWTQPSIASLFCGCYPEVHGVTSFRTAVTGARDQSVRVKVLADEVDTMAERFARAGYATAAFVANPFVVSGFGFAQGFETFDSHFASNTTPGQVVNGAADRWLAERPRGRPFFLYLHYMDVHGPYAAPDEILDPLLRRVESMKDRRELTDQERQLLGYLRVPPPGTREPERHRRLMRYREYWVARYEAGVRVFDRVWAELRGILRRRGLWDETLLVLASDHGEALCERGWWDHGLSLHEEELHVPLLWRWPGHIAAGRRVQGTVSLIDVLPTLAELAGLEVGDQVQGHSLARWLRKDGPERLEDPVPVLAGAVKLGHQHALFVDPWKLIRDEDRRMHMLYLMRDGRFELVDARQERERVARFHEIMDGIIERGRQLRGGRKVPKTGLTEAQKERLRALGYLE